MLGRLKIFVAVAFLALGGIGPMFSAPIRASADSGHRQTLEVVKYGLTPGASGFVEDQTKNDGTAINNLPTDNNGNELSPVAGIHYRIQEIIPKSGDMATTNPTSDSYQTVGDVQEIVTDGNGIATISLADGIYLLSEVANPSAGLNEPALPVVIQLPQYKTDSSAMLDTVYVYPKSSVDKNDSNNGGDPPAVIPPGDNKPGTNQPMTNKPKGKENQDLPKTGAGDDELMLIAGLVVVLAALVLYGKSKVKVRTF